MGNRIVITTYGSLGDLHPYMAIALELKTRGHQVVIATNALYRSTIEAAGIEFHSVRPDTLSFSHEKVKQIVQLGMDRTRGSKYVICELLLPYLKASYEDLMQAVCDADLLLTHPMTFAGPIVAEKTGIRWVSSVLAPISLISAFDPPIMPTQTSGNLRALGPLINSGLFWYGKQMLKPWSEPIRQLRTEQGLSEGKDPLFEGQHSPDLVLALFSQVFAHPQLDWPKQTRITGFPFYDCWNSQTELPSELTQFLDAGPPPIVFTLGSAAAQDAGNFYLESAIAARKLGYRAVLLTGEDKCNVPKSLLSENIIAFDYVSYSELFPRAAAIVHHGGIGTTAQALRSGRPMLIMPYSHDQPDNAARAKRLGVALTIDRTSYTAESVAIVLKYLLNYPRYSKLASEVGRRIQSENGVQAVCNEIEAQIKVPT